MSYDVLIRKNATGEVRRYTLEEDTWEDETEDGKGTIFLWEDGNYSCDCNRALFFDRSINKERDPRAYHCSDGRYSVLKAILPSGKEISIDD